MTQPAAASLFGEEPIDESFWLKLMEECLENPVTRLPAGKRLLVIGDSEADKSQIISKLQGTNVSDASIKKGNGLEYRYLNVRDEYCDSQTKLGVWILDGDLHYKSLLKYAFDERTLADTTVMLVATMTKPWDIFDTIHSWTNVLKNYIEGLNMLEKDLQERKNKILEKFREYMEPGLSIYGSLTADNTRELKVNLGMDIIVVISKTEYMHELQTEFGYEEEHFDFIQLSLREFCLAYGASLFYVSVKEDKNCDYLLKYILHRIYSFPFRFPGILIERDSILVPSGWDNENKIRFLSESLTTIPFSMPYEEVVFKPTRLMAGKRIAPEVFAENDQDFLASMQKALDRIAVEEKASESAKESTNITASVVQRNVARRMTRAHPGRASQKKADTKQVPTGGDTVLTSFFHSLLNRRTSAPVDRPIGLTGARTYNPKINLDNLTDSKKSSLMDRQDSQSSDDMKEESSSESNPPNKDIEGEEFGDNAHLKLKNTVHLSLDQDVDMRQLPEYFLSKQECGADCAFPSDSKSSSLEVDEELSPPLDRVKSSFNLPLKLILEKSHPREEVNGFENSSTVKDPGDTQTNGGEVNSVHLE